MSVIVVSGILRDQLMASSGEAELRDDAGKLLGRFVPPERDVPVLDMKDEEIAYELSPDRKTLTTAEVLSHLKGLVS